MVFIHTSQTRRNHVFSRSTNIMQQWSDTNRFNQTGYSAPTIFPEAKNYVNKEFFAEDLAKAQARQESHLEWLWEEREEARIEEAIRRAEIKAEQEEWM